MQIRATDLSEPEVIALIELHTREMFEGSPPGTNHALDLSGLQEPRIEVFAAWDDRQLLAIGAVKKHSEYCEIKSMRAHPDARGKGAGKSMLIHLLERARELGFSEVKLETGSGPLFDAAITLYKRFGFEPCAPFAGYIPSEFNKLYALHL